MDERTLKRLDAVVDAIREQLSPRVSALARRSTRGELTAAEKREYADIVRLNDALGIAKLQAAALRPVRGAP